MMNRTIDNKRRLQDMCLEELWRLFPVILEEHNREWNDWADEEIVLLKRILLEFNPIITHIGSTAIPFICAKPIVDILVETATTDGWSGVVELMESNGYILMSRSDERMSFNKGYTTEGYEERVFHIHFHIKGDNNEILFRDFLMAHPSVAKEYEKLKLSLASKYRYNRDGYTEAKSGFITKVISAIREKN